MAGTIIRNVQQQNFQRKVQETNGEKIFCLEKKIPRKETDSASVFSKC